MTPQHKIDGVDATDGQTFTWFTDKVSFKKLLNFLGCLII